MGPLHRLWKTLGAVAGWAALVAGAPAASEHPTDGPDCELRFQLRPDRVEVQVRMNLAFFDEVSEAPREVPDEVAEPEWPAHEDALAALVAEHLHLEAEGVQLAGAPTGFRVLEALEEMLGLFPTFGARAMVQLQLQLEYPLAAAPSRLSMRWDLYPPNPVLNVSGTAPPVDVTGQLHDGRYDYPLLFQAGEPEYIWHGEVTDPVDLFLPVPEPPQADTRRVPVLSLALAALGIAAAGTGLARSRQSFARARRPLGLAALLGLGALLSRELTASPWSLPWPGADPLRGLDAERAGIIFENLHANVYNAFEYDDESDVYDALARSVDGDLLERLYGQIYRSLIMEEEGGAVARVQAVRHLTTEVEGLGELAEYEALGFTVLARWQVDGKVTHYGHSHERTNEYLARYVVREAEGGWRIAADQVLESRVLSAAPVEDPRADRAREL